MFRDGLFFCQSVIVIELLGKKVTLGAKFGFSNQTINWIEHFYDHHVEMDTRKPPQSLEDFERSFEFRSHVLGHLQVEENLLKECVRQKPNIFTLCF